jgi:hypothetical protein
MGEFQIQLRMSNCANLRDLKAAQDLARLVRSYGFQFADPKKNFEITEDIDELVSQFWEPNNQWDPRKPFAVWPLYSIYIRVFPEVARGTIASFGCAFWGLDHSIFEIGELVDPEIEDQRRVLEPFTKNLKDISLLLYGKLRPSFAYVDESQGMGRHIKEAVKVQLKILGWINIFGPPFVEKYGKDFLLNLPGYEVRELEDGGVFHQLTPGILANNSSEVDKIQEEVESYCSKAGVRLKCAAPYYISPP